MCAWVCLAGHVWSFSEKASEQRISSKACYGNRSFQNFISISNKFTTVHFKYRYLRHTLPIVYISVTFLLSWRAFQSWSPKCGLVIMITSELDNRWIFAEGASIPTVKAGHSAFALAAPVTRMGSSSFANPLTDGNVGRSFIWRVLRTQLMAMAILYQDLNSRKKGDGTCTAALETCGRIKQPKDRLFWTQIGFSASFTYSRYLTVVRPKISKNSTFYKTFCWFSKQKHIHEMNNIHMAFDCLVICLIFQIVC